MRRCVRHLFAFLGAAFAGFRAFPAMIHVMLAAFGRATAADFGAMLANVPGFFRIARHQRSREPAEVRAIPIEFDAARHHFHIVFVQAGGCAMLAYRGTLIASLDAILIFFVGHIGYSFLQASFSFGRMDGNRAAPESPGQAMDHKPGES